MSETFDKFKRMMELAKQNQKHFEKELKKLEYEDDLKDDDVTQITQEELDEAEKHNKSLYEMNRQNINELSKLSVSSPKSSTGYLCDIARSLREISKSLSNIEDHLTDNKEADWND
ncbi:hypothetical protein [Limosilactobacillus reuteri]|uniref:hypothetical protein n=1 Tax=Limosilactobacillus reuteri TaxID=1598 RepID=UPI0021BA6F78|nr:hypothetical protein [Limosilactobacillus reuteri]UXE90196.1 hypothetical protein N4560_04890 [Limosilactobacillus reuteri]